MFEIRNIHADSKLGLLDLALFATERGLTAKRDIEKEGALFLLNKLFDKKVELDYSILGKPFLKNESAHISISHSHNKLAIICDTKAATGVDVEQIRDKVLRIKHKFLSKREIRCANDDIEKLIVYWACKEALYKINGLEKIDFVVHLLVQDFELKNEGVLLGEVRVENFHKKYRLHYEKSEDYVLVYVLNEA